MKEKTTKPTRSPFTILSQICNSIPQYEFSKIARHTGVEDQPCTFSPWSHTVSQCHAQLSHCLGLNGLCDGLQLHSGPLSTVHGATPPCSNGLSHANRERQAEMAEQLFRRTLAHLKEQSPGFAAGQRRGPAFRFKLPIHVIDSTTLELADFLGHNTNAVAAWCNFAAICSGLCRVLFMLSEFRAALRAIQSSHNTWISLRGAFQF